LLEASRGNDKIHTLKYSGVQLGGGYTSHSSQDFSVLCKAGSGCASLKTALNMAPPVQYSREYWAWRSNWVYVTTERVLSDLMQYMICWVAEKEPPLEKGQHLSIKVF